MTSEEQMRWERGNIGGQPVLTARTVEAQLVFGIGPPKPSNDSQQRMDRLLESLDPSVTGLRWGQQIHGRLLASLAAENGRSLTAARCVGRCDGLITADEALGLVVWTADCVPLLVSGGGVVAAVHSGWRGTAEDIIGAVIDRFRIEFGVPPDRLRVALGPAISGPRYPVGKEVVTALGRFGVEESTWLRGTNVDLRAFLVARIQALGVPESAIETVGSCTASTPELASFRRDGEAAGRQWALIYRSTTDRKL
jgi:YfiH family protein